MEVRCGEEVANRSDPESCGGAREGAAEALIGETDRPGIEPRNHESGMPTLLSDAEGNTEQGVNRKSCNGPARSETLSMPGSLLHRSWEVSSVPVSQGAGRAGKAFRRNPAIHADEKSDTPIVPRKPSNKGVHPAEAVEGRGVAKGNTDENPAPRTQSRTSRASMGLEGVREAVRRDRRLRFTALLHHITPELLAESFYALERQASAGVDGVTWREYEKVLPERLPVLHRKIHTGAYRARPSRRVYIPKADGRQRPLGIASIEDKIVQQAVVTVLSAIYEEDFLGFSYGFRLGRGQHDALDALTAGIRSQKVDWILDADIRSFLDTASYCPQVHESCSNSSGCRSTTLIRKPLRRPCLTRTA
ncbi:MAG: reverse transcriptase domain-containing protein, partial [Bryobacteraceae bacterium]